jgi:hypothetical protein
VTSLSDLGWRVSMAEVDMVLRREFEPLFGPTIDQIVDTCGLEKTDTDKTLVNQSDSL